MKKNNIIAVTVVSAIIGMVSGFMLCAICMKNTLDSLFKHLPSSITSEEDEFYDMDPHLTD